MNIVLGLVIGTAISFVTLVIVVVIAHKWADISVPPWPEAIWKLAAVAAAANVASMALDPVNGFLGWVAGVAAFWTLMVKWFDVDLFGAMVIAVATWLVKWFLVLSLIASLMPASVD